MGKAVLLALSVLATAASAQPASPGRVIVAAAPSHGARHGSHGHANHADWKFMRDAAAGAQALIAAGKLAMAKGQDSAVRRLGTLVVQQNTALARELSLLSLFKQVPLPSRADRAQRKALSGWSALSGESFDRAFLKYVLETQRPLVGMLQQEAASPAADPALRDTARQYLPKLQARLAEAQRLERESLANAAPPH